MRQLSAADAAEVAAVNRGALATIAAHPGEADETRRILGLPSRDQMRAIAFAITRSLPAT